MAIARETVEVLEGRIEVESVPVKGCTFTVCLSEKKRLPDKEKLSEKN